MVITGRFTSTLENGRIKLEYWLLLENTNILWFRRLGVTNVQNIVTILALPGTLAELIVKSLLVLSRLGH